MKLQLKACSHSPARLIDSHTVQFSTIIFPSVFIQGMDMNAMEADPNAPMQTMQAKAAQAKKDKKVKPTRGGGGGFGAR